MPKTIEQNFSDWESTVFGFGYGTGEEHVLSALKMFFGLCGLDRGKPCCYDYKVLEAGLGPTVTWLLINTLCKHGVDVIEYGTSPRYAWLTTEGEALKAFVDSKTVDRLVEICTEADGPGNTCYPDACNCGPEGYQKGVKCPNPFWAGHH